MDAAVGDSEPAGRPERGRAAVERRLIEAAAELLGEVGPKQLSMRTLSARAQANSGQVYHYFGSKEALLRAAMRHLYERHHEHTLDPTAGGLLEDKHYWRALGHAVLDGAEDLYTQELETGRSEPLTYLDSVRADAGGTLDVDQTAAALSNVAIVLGWTTFEPFIMAVVGEGPDRPDKEELRRSIERMLVERMGTGWMR